MFVFPLLRRTERSRSDAGSTGRRYKLQFTQIQFVKNLIAFGISPAEKASWSEVLMKPNACFPALDAGSTGRNNKLRLISIPFVKKPHCLRHFSSGESKLIRNAEQPLNLTFVFPHSMRDPLGGTINYAWFQYHSWKNLIAFGISPAEKASLS
jgi:hypothetical protein